MKENKPKKAHMQLRAPLGEEEQRLQVEKKKQSPSERPDKERGAGLKSRQRESEWEMITKRDAT